MPVTHSGCVRFRYLNLLGQELRDTANAGIMLVRHFGSVAVEGVSPVFISKLVADL